MKTIEDVLTASTADLMKILTQLLLTYYPKNVWVLDDDFVYAVGTNPICIMAHVDTVRDPQASAEMKWSRKGATELPVSLYQEHNILRNANGVLGADDRAGVFACLELIRKCKREKTPMPSVIFTNGEESGGLGIGSFVSTDAFKKHDEGRTRLFVEMDRCNATEWVTYGGPLPTEVVKYVESFGFHKGNGSYSDVADMQDEYLIPGVNLSIGYYKQHTSDERLLIDEMYMTIGRVMNMLRSPIDKLYEVKPYQRYSASNYDWRDWYGDTGHHSDSRTSGSDALLRGSGNSTKKDESGSDGKESHGFPHTKKGMSGIDTALEIIAKDGWCHSCGHEFEECECGHILTEIVSNLTNEEITYLIDNYLTEGSRLATLLEVYLESQNAAKVEDTKDPFHVGKEGDPVPQIEMKVSTSAEPEVIETTATVVETKETTTEGGE